MISSHRSSIIKEIVQLSLAGLGQMYLPDHSAFCFRTKRTAGGLSRVGISRTNTLITSIGIRRAEIAGYQAPIEMQPVIRSLSESGWRFDKIGDIGLYLWLSSMFPVHENLLKWPDVLIESALDNLKDARERRTMELAWFLSGLAETADRRDLDASKKRTLLKLAMRTFTLLRANQESSGLFRHMSFRNSVAGLFRSHIASFADQIYPIYALSRFSEVFGIETALDSALSCANRICELQGPLGQWWWHYDAVGGRVVGPYPVYSVHQDAMAPMALFAINSASGKDFNEPVFRGLNWITGQNELSIDLRERGLNVIWRNIHQSTVERYFEESRMLIFPNRKTFSSQRLNVLFECHPYHLGWILFAFAGRTNTSCSFSGA